MFLLFSPFTDPHFNLALEEYLFSEKGEEYLLIYRNEDSVIVGKHQNAVAEANLHFLEENKVPLIRRFSGGGTVFHDAGNINFSFITTGVNTKVIDFKKYANPIVDFLRSLGVPAELSTRNDIMIEGKKVSGNAAHAKGKRALHHGTLLFDSDLQNLSAGLKVTKDKFISRGVQSVRSPVTNISNYLQDQMDIELFTTALVEHLQSAFGVNITDAISTKDEKEVTALVAQKYNTFEWNYGYSPAYSFEVEQVVNGERLCFSATVEKGLFTKIVFAETCKFTAVVSGLQGNKHLPEDIYNVFSGHLDAQTSSELMRVFF